MNPQHPEQHQRKLQCAKIYCGDQEILPDGYHVFGTRSQCLRRGVGVGMHIQRDEAGRQRSPHSPPSSSPPSSNHTPPLIHSFSDKDISLSSFVTPLPFSSSISSLPNNNKEEKEKEEKKGRRRREEGEQKQELSSQQLKRESRTFFEEHIDTALRDYPELHNIDDMFRHLAYLARYRQQQ